MELQAMYRFDRGEARVDGDLLRLEAHGGLSLDGVHQMMQVFRLMADKHGQFFMLANLHDGGLMPPAVRRLIAETAPALAPAAIAFYGGNLEIRATNALMMAAIKKLGGLSQNITYFPTGEEAEQWLAAERRRLSAR